MSIYRRHCIAAAWLCMVILPAGCDTPDTDPPDQPAQSAMPREPAPPADAITGAASDQATPPAVETIRYRRRLVTKNYIVTITGRCPEGHVSCDQVDYHGVSKRSGNAIRLTGSTFHTTAADGSPGRFLGYIFKNGKTTYTVLEQGRLSVTDGRSKLLVDEAGQWEDVEPN